MDHHVSQKKAKEMIHYIITDASDDSQDFSDGVEEILRIGVGDPDILREILYNTHEAKKYLDHLKDSFE